MKYRHEKDPLKGHDARYRMKHGGGRIVLIAVIAVLACALAVLVWRMAARGNEGGVPDTAPASQTVDGTQEGPASAAPDGAQTGPETQGGSQTATETQTQAETQTETEHVPVVQTVSISAAGDVSLGTLQTHGYGGSLRQAAEENGTSYFFQNVRHIFENDDMTLVNFEGVLTYSTEARSDQEYLIKGDPEWISALPEGSIEAVAFSNNHDYDYLQQGWDDTVSAFESAGLVWSAEDSYGYYTTDEGFTIGMVSVNKLNRLEEARETLRRGITALREEGVDIVIAYIHIGIEMSYYPEEYEVELDRQCVDWGANLVLNTHTHCIRGIEEYNGRFIVHGLGNFCFGANRNPSDKDSMIFCQTWTFIDGVLQPDIDVHVEPCLISSTPGRNDYCPTTLTGSEYDRVLANINTYSEPFNTRFDENGDYVPS